MTRVENHNPFVRQHQEGGVIVIIGLKPGTDHHLIPPVKKMIDLCSLDVPLHIDITNIGAIDGAALIFIVQRSRIGKPAPGSFFGNCIYREPVL